MVHRQRRTAIIAAVAALAAVIALWLFLPANYYLRQALRHLHPKIDNYAIFANRTVTAGNPHPWALSDDFNTLEIPSKYSEAFERYGTAAYVIVHDGKLLFEQYWDDYSPQSHSNSFSMAKSIVSLAVGCAIDDGYIKSIDQNVDEFFPQFFGYNGKALTIKHLLTMSAGMDFKEAYSSVFSPTTKLYYGNDIKAVTFGMNEIEEPGKRFEYQSAVTQLLAYIVEKAVGENISAYVSRRIWTPLQAEESALWSLDREGGMEKAYCCFNSNAADFARLGQLVLNEGAWDSSQVVSK